MIKIVVAFLMLVICSCGSPLSDDSMRRFIPGVYERQFDEAVSRGKVVLRIYNLQGDNYAIERLSAVIRKTEEGELPVRYDTAHWTAAYHADKRALYEQQKGKILLLLPKENKLMIGGSIYKKLK